MTLSEVLEEELLVEAVLIDDLLVERKGKNLSLTSKGRELLARAKKNKVSKKYEIITSKPRSMSTTDKSGRERIISALINRVEHKGGSLSYSEAKKLILARYDDWLEKKLRWINKAERKSTSLGFSPRKYKDQKPGDSAGKGNPGQPEYKGRAYYFVTFLNTLANEILKKQGKSNFYEKGEKFSVS